MQFRSSFKVIEFMLRSLQYIQYMHISSFTETASFYLQYFVCHDRYRLYTQILLHNYHEVLSQIINIRERSCFFLE